jgi:hypothetical protein
MLPYGMDDSVGLIPVDIPHEEMADTITPPSIPGGGTKVCFVDSSTSGSTDA